LRLQRIQKYGPASEKLSNAQLELLEEEPPHNLEVAAESGARNRCRSGAASSQAHTQAPRTPDIAAQICRG